MSNTLTPDGVLVLQALALLCAIAYIIVQAIRGKGIAVLPDWLVPLIGGTFTSTAISK